MQHIIIGTAGHIDHGKTTLIKVMTGRETDTLREEKERGISINLGFTYFDLPSGKRAGIIDVPGHEKFIKNMLAGVGGIDIVLLVIAADEGIMPQTKEHINILELLDIKKGVVVVTKIDMVDEEWLSMITEEIKGYVSSTFLKDAPIIPVSSVTGEGIDFLSRTVDELTNEIKGRDMATEFRIPIDRVFSVSGFGTVITGTLISGIISEGDLCEIYPNGVRTRIRGIQIHEESVQTAKAGQRVAVNIASVKIGEVNRGDVLSKPGIMENSMMIDCRLRYLKDAPRPLKNRDRVRIYHGTSELLGRVVILDKDIVNPGETALIQIRLENSMAARRGDKYVIRSYSPMVTIGGGTILEPNASKHKANDIKIIEELKIKEVGDPKDVVEQVIFKNSNIYPKKDDIIKLSGKGVLNIDKIIGNLIDENKILGIGSNDDMVYIHMKFYENIKQKSKELLEKFHMDNPLLQGISKEEFKTRVFDKNVKQKIYDGLINLLREDTINVGASFVALKEFKIKFNQKQGEIKDKILNKYINSKLQPPKTDELIDSFVKEEKTARTIISLLIESGELIKINQDMIITSNEYNTAKQILIDYINSNGEMTAAQYRDAIGVSRKYAVAYLEYFDLIKLTKRVGDKRVLA